MNGDQILWEPQTASPPLPSSVTLKASLPCEALVPRGGPCSPKRNQPPWGHPRGVLGNPAATASRRRGFVKALNRPGGIDQPIGWAHR